MTRLPPSGLLSLSGRLQVWMSWVSSGSEGEEEEGALGPVRLRLGGGRRGVIIRPLWICVHQEEGAKEARWGTGLGLACICAAAAAAVLCSRRSCWRFVMSSWARKGGWSEHMPTVSARPVAQRTCS